MRPTARRAAFATAAVGAVRQDGPTAAAGRIASIPGMLRDTLLGRWRGLGRGRLLLLAVGVAYLVSPVDVLPELLLTIPGLADDALVAGWVVASLLSAAGDYRDWRSGGLGAASPRFEPSFASPGAPSGRTVPGTVVTSTGAATG